MELVNDHQKPALFAAILFLLAMIVGSYDITHFFYASQTQANEFFWYMDRAAGFTAYELLAMTALLGQTSGMGLWDRWQLRKFALDVHQFLSIFFFAFLALHLWGLFEDTSLPFSLAQLLVPLQSSYRAIPVSFGILSLYAIVVIVVSSYLRPRIKSKVWRVIHQLSRPAFVLVTFHGLLSGTDTGNHWALLFYIVPILLFFLLAFWRLRQTGSQRSVWNAPKNAR